MSNNDFWSLVEKEKKKKFGVNSGLNISNTPTGAFGELVEQQKVKDDPFRQVIKNGSTGSGNIKTLDTDDALDFTYTSKSIAKHKQAYEELPEAIKAGSKIRSFLTVTSNEDFKEKSGYISTKADGIWDKLSSKYGMGYNDLQYEYINNKDGIRDEIAHKAISWGSDTGKTVSSYEEKALDYMTDDEIAVYNYYYQTEGKQKAQKFLDALAETLSARKAGKDFTSLQGKTAKEIIYGIEAGSHQFEQGVKNLGKMIVGKDDYIPQTSTQILTGMVREDLADDGPKILGNSLGQVGFDVVNTGANMFPSLVTSTAISAFNPVAGAVVGNALLGSSAAGNAYQQVLNEGYDKDKAKIYATSIGTLEALLQYALGGIGKLGGTSAAISRGVSGIKNGLLRFSLEYGGKIASEAVEEGLQEVLDPLVKNAVLGTDESVDWENVTYSALLGGLMGGVYGSVEVSQSHLNNDEQTVLNSVTESLIAQAQEKSDKKLSNREKNKIAETARTLVEKGYVKAEIIESILGGESYEAFKGEWDTFFGSDTYKAYREAVKGEESLPELETQLAELGKLPSTVENTKKYDALQSRIEAIKNAPKSADLKAQLDINAVKLREMQSKLHDEVYARVKGSRLAESYRELYRRKEKFTVDPGKYENEYARQTVQNILDSGLGDGTNQFRDTVELMARISADHNEVIFNLTDTDGVKKAGHYKAGYVTNGFVTDDGKITLNYDSPNILESIVGHEITHVLEKAGNYKALRQAIFDYAISKEGLDKFNARLKEKENAYRGKKNTSPEGEVAADLIGEYLFTDYNFIANLAKTDMNGFQRMWNEVKYMFKIAVTGSKEARQLEKVKHMFEKAYNENLKGKVKPKAETEVGTEESKLSMSEELTPSQAQMMNIFVSNITNVASRNGISLRDFYIATSDINAFGMTKADAKMTADLLQPIVDQLGIENYQGYLDKMREFAEDADAPETGVKYSYGRPDFNQSEWSIVNRRKYSEFGNPKYDLDNDTKWMYANEKGSTVFAIYSKSDPDDPVVMYGSRGKKAERDHTELNDYLSGRRKNGKRNKATLDRLLGDLESKHRDWGDGVLAVGSGQSAIADVPFPVGERGSNGRGDYIDGTENRQGTELTEYDNEASGYPDASSITFSNDYQAIRNFMKEGDTGEPEVQYSVTKDSEGKQLSNGQREFFKDSKAVDGAGNLLKVYHTTNNDFTVFDKSRKGEATGDYNTYLGFFFADDPSYMSQFPEFENGKTEAYYLNITNPIDMNNISRQAFLDVVEASGGDVNEAAEVYDREYADELQRMKNNGYSSTIMELPRLLEELTGEYFDYAEFYNALKPKYEQLMSKGYDGIINSLDGRGFANEYIVLDSNQAKLITNENPTADPDIRYSYSSIANSFFGDENMSTKEFLEADYTQTQGYKDYVEQCLNNFRQSRGTTFDEVAARMAIEDSIRGIVDVAIASKQAGYDIFDDAQKRTTQDSKKRLLFSSLEPNSDYFTSNDISTICDKRQNFAEIYDEIVRQEEAKGVPNGKRFFDNINNYFAIHKIMAEKGLTTPCRQCYVESMRKNLAPMASAFMRLVGETNPDNTANDQLYHQTGKNKGNLKVNNASLREAVLSIFEANPQYPIRLEDLTIEMLTTEEGLARLRLQAPLVYEAFNSFYGQAKPKMPKSATPFRFGELTALLTDNKGNINPRLVSLINSTGGFRLQSYSDFQIKNYVDVLQVLFEAGTLGLNGHAYTKVPAFLDATEGTNLKRNISIFMYKDGDEWKLDRNDSFPYTLEEIYKLVNDDKTGNTSIIAVSQNKEMSAWIMANDYVGYGIPFHKSGLKMSTVRDTVVRTEDGRDVKGYTGTIDHTKQQTEVWKDTVYDENGDIVHKKETKVKKGINIYELWDFENKANLPKNELIKKNLMAYIDACEGAGYLPKFRDYVMNNEKVLKDVLKYSKELGFVGEDATIDDISFEYKGYRIPYGYYKFLGDFGMFTPDGKAAPQKTLSLEGYDFEKAKAFFSDAESLRRNEILQQFANGTVRDEFRESGMETEDLEKLVKQKRSEVASEALNGKRSLTKETENAHPYGYYPTKDNRVYNPLDEFAPVRQDVAPKTDVAPAPATVSNTEMVEDMSPDEPVSIEQLYARQEEIKDLLYSALDGGDPTVIDELSIEYETIREQIAELEADDADRFDSIDDTDAPPEADVAPFERADVVPLTKKAAQDIARDVRQRLGLSNKQMYDVHMLIEEYSRSEFADRAQLFRDIKAKFGTYTETEYDETVKEAKSYLRTYGLFVSDSIKKEIADYAHLMRRNRGRIRFSKEGTDVDVLYHELNELFPHLFPEDIIAPTDQFMQMIEVANMDAESKVEQEIPDEEIWRVADAVSQGVREYQLAQREKAANKYGREAFNSLMRDADQYVPPAREDIAPVATEPARDEIAPTTSNVAPQANTAPSETGEPKTATERLAKKLENYNNELARNNQLRAQSNIDYDNEIARLQAEYDAKANKRSMSAHDLLRRIERMKRMKNNVDADYAKRISDLEKRIEKLSTKEAKTAAQRQTKMDEHTDTWADTIGDTSTWKDLPLGLLYKTKTLRRILRTVVRDANGKPNIELADRIYDMIETKYDHNEALLKRESARLKEVFEKLNLNHHEDTYAHMLGELRHNPDSELTEDVVKEFYNKHKKHIDSKKVDTAIAEARKTFDELLVRVNTALREQGFKEIPYRKGYFPHFTNPKQGWLAKLLNWKTIDTEVPTSIAGLTEQFKPQRSWQSFNKERKGDTTDYSLYQGLDTYIHGALDWIYHIDDLQSRRALENYLRYIHSEEGVKARIDEIKANEEYDADEAQALIDGVLREAENPLSGLVRELMNRTNTLANKKAAGDRKMEDDTNRKVYSVMTNLNNRINANMVVGSISSALTNFIPMVQSWHQVSPVFTVRGLGDYIRSVVRDDGMMGRSDFLTNRLMDEEKLYQTGWDKVSDKAAWMMNIADRITTNTVWRSKYLQNIKEGMSEAEAIKDADQFAKNLMAGRSRGNAPTIFDEKNPASKLFTAFQLEVANQYGYMFEDVPKDSKNMARLVKGYATALVGAYVYNALYSSLVGRDAAFDPIKIIEELFKDLTDDDEEPEDIALNFVDNVLEEVPFVGGLVGGGRIPISSALPYEGDYKTFISDAFNGEIKVKEMLKPLYYLAMPVGGGQIKKTFEGLSMFDDDLPVTGSYTDSGKLRFPVDKTLGNVVQAGMFGQYASENARYYFDNDIAPLGDKQIQEYKDVDIPIRDYWDYRKGLSGLETAQEKADYINGLNLPIRKKNILINNQLNRKEPIDMRNYGDYGSLEEFDFAQKNPEKYDFFSSIGVTYQDYKNANEEAKDVYNWAFDYPEKYSVSKAVTDDLFEYKRYTNELGEIRADKDSNGKTINGSAKAKKAEYIFSLPIDYGRQIILYRSLYDSKDDRKEYDEDIVYYLNGREDLTYDDRIAILKELGFTVRNGTVYWD